MGRELYLVNRPRFAIDEGGLPLVVHGDGGETGQSQAGRKWVLKESMSIIIPIELARRLTPGTLSLSSYRTCMFRTVTWRLLTILVTRDAMSPCDWEASDGAPKHCLRLRSASSTLTLRDVGLGSDMEKLRALEALKLGSLSTTFLLFGVIGRFG